MGCIDHVGNSGQPPRRSLAFTLSSGQRFNREIFGKFREALKVSRFGTLFWKDRRIGLPKTSTCYYLKWKPLQKYKNSPKRSKKGEACFGNICTECQIQWGLSSRSLGSRTKFHLFLCSLPPWQLYNIWAHLVFIMTGRKLSSDVNSGRWRKHAKFLIRPALPKFYPSMLYSKILHISVPAREFVVPLKTRRPVGGGWQGWKVSWWEPWEVSRGFWRYAAANQPPHHLFSQHKQFW